MSETKINASQTTITASDIGAASAASTLPTASATEEGKIYQFIGTTDANYTNGYFYKCVSDGGVTPTYSWTRVDVQPTPSELPSQSGQSGKYLTTNGTNASWATISALTNTGTGTESLGITAVASGERTTAVGQGASCYSQNSCAFGVYADTKYAQRATSIGKDSQATGHNSTSLGFAARAAAVQAIQIGATGSSYTYNSDANTMKVANANGNFEIMSSDGTIPADRLTHSINKYSSMPTASSTNLGWVVQFTGTTDATYTHGYIYECTTDGSTYSWTQTNVQPAGGGSSLPSQTGNAGKVLTTDGTDASWGNTVNAPIYINNTNNGQSLRFVNYVSGSSTIVGIERYSSSYSQAFIHFNTNPERIEIRGHAGNISDGILCISGAGGWLENSGTSRYWGDSSYPWYTIYVTKLNNGADINVPTYTGTMVVADFTGATQGQVLTLDSNLKPTWANAGGGGGSTSATATLAVNDWSSNTQTVNVTGVTASNNVIVSAAPASQTAYTSAGVICTAQGAGTLSFSCQTVPTNAITVNILIL